MAHGCQESAFGDVGLLCLLPRLVELGFQLLTFGDVDPATQQALQLTIGPVKRYGPLIGLNQPAKELHLPVSEHRLPGFQQFQVIGVHLFRTRTRNQIHIDQASATHLFKTDSEAFLITAVARNQPTIEVPHINRVGDTVEQGMLEGQLITELFLGPEPLANLDLQATAPDQRDQAQHQSDGKGPINPWRDALPDRGLRDDRTQPLQANSP